MRECSEWIESMRDESEYNRNEARTKFFRWLEGVTGEDKDTTQRDYETHFHGQMARRRRRGLGEVLIPGKESQIAIAMTA